MMENETEIRGQQEAFLADGESICSDDVLGAIRDMSDDEEPNEKVERDSPVLPRGCRSLDDIKINDKEEFGNSTDLDVLLKNFLKRLSPKRGGSTPTRSHQTPEEGVDDHDFDGNISGNHRFGDGSLNEPAPTSLSGRSRYLYIDTGQPSTSSRSQNQVCSEQPIQFTASTSQEEDSNAPDFSRQFYSNTVRNPSSTYLRRPASPNTSVILAELMLGMLPSDTPTRRRERACQLLREVVQEKQLSQQISAFQNFNTQQPSPDHPMLPYGQANTIGMYPNTSYPPIGPLPGIHHAPVPFPVSHIPNTIQGMRPLLSGPLPSIAELTQRLPEDHYLDQSSSIHALTPVLPKSTNTGRQVSGRCVRPKAL